MDPAVLAKKRADIAASFQKTAVDHLVQRVGRPLPLAPPEVVHAHNLAWGLPMPRLSGSHSPAVPQGNRPGERACTRCEECLGGGRRRGQQAGPKAA